MLDSIMKNKVAACLFPMERMLLGDTSCIHAVYYNLDKRAVKENTGQNTD